MYLKCILIIHSMLPTSLRTFHCISHIIAQRINELIRNYDPPQSNETDPTCECVAERIAMVMKMHTPEEQVVIANSIASRIMKAGEVDVPSGVDHKKHASIYTCHEDECVTMVTDNKEDEDGGRGHAQKREASQVSFIR